VFAEDLNAPYGLAYVDGYVFVANQDALVRFPYQTGQTRLTASPEEVTQLPSALNHHWTKAMTASADGQTVYVGIGSNSNVGERGMAVEEERAVVWAIDRTTGARRTVARGIRNPTAMAPVRPFAADLHSLLLSGTRVGEKKAA
jgi:glucose/arabinose dehydrogenase